MPITPIDINDLTSIGVVQDEPGYQLAPEAWTIGNNMRVLDNGMRRLFGWSPIFNSQVIGGDYAAENNIDQYVDETGVNSYVTEVLAPGLPDKPYYLMYVSSVAQSWWIWASLTDMYVWDGTQNTNISKSLAAYHAGDSKTLNGTIFGGTPIVNTGNDPPQMWFGVYSASLKMADLTAWPSGPGGPYQAKVIRAFGPYLVALGITIPGATVSSLPHRVLWSTEGAPGAVPPSWNVADPTVDAGQNDLPDADSGIVLDGMGLQGNFYIYKEAAVWRMRFIGGRFIFTFEPFLESVGLLCTRAVCLTGSGQNHVFVSQDDMLTHNGNTAEALLDNRFKRYLFNQIDTTNFSTSFMMNNPLYDECWFCYPAIGASEPNRALIWNWKHNRFTEADIDFQCSAVGQTSIVSSGSWSQATIPWSSDPAAWAVSQRRRTVIGNPTTGKIHLLDSGSLRDGVLFTGTLQRSNLAVIGKKRNGEWIVDWQRKKQINRVWPKALIGPVTVRIGYQDTIGGMIRWSNPQTFNPITQRFVDGVLGSGSSVAVEFSATNDFRLDGYKIDLVPLGMF